MSKSQSSNVDCRCDGAEMSVRDQRVGTSHSDRMREDVSLEYVMLSKRITDEYGSEWLETVAMTPQGIQPHSEEKEIVCLV